MPLIREISCLFHVSFSLFKYDFSHSACFCVCFLNRDSVSEDVFGHVQSQCSSSRHEASDPGFNQAELMNLNVHRWFVATSGAFFSRLVPVYQFGLKM